MNARSLVVVALAAPFLFSMSVGCSTESDDRPPANVIIVVVDALRADHVGVYGYGRGTTSEIDRLAQTALVFENGYSNATFTFPSTASLFTSTLPTVHRITWSPEHQEKIRRLSDQYTLLPEVFHDAGYRTGLLTFPGWVTPTANYMQGVDVRVESERSDDDLLAKAREFIDGSGSQPFFLYLHFIDMHDYFFPSHLFGGADPSKLGLSDSLLTLKDMEISQAYDALAYQLNQPGRLTDRDLEYLIEHYDRRLRNTDRVIGELARHLEDQGMLDRTFIVLTADHGEQFLEHGRLVHGADGFYNEVIHIPYIISNPLEFDGPIMVSTPVTSIDIGPTVLDLVGLGAPIEFQGESFADGRDQDRVVFATDGRTWKAISRDWSYIVSEAKNREELYNLASDPGESVNLVSERPDMVEIGRRQVSQMQQRSAAHVYLSIDVEEIDMPKEQEEALRSLGYVE